MDAMPCVGKARQRIIVAIAEMQVFAAQPYQEDQRAWLIKVLPVPYSCHKVFHTCIKAVIDAVRVALVLEDDIG